jgi:hypothetical protein
MAVEAQAPCSVAIIKIIIIIIITTTDEYLRCMNVRSANDVQLHWLHFALTLQDGNLLTQ